MKKDIRYIVKEFLYWSKFFLIPVIISFLVQFIWILSKNLYIFFLQKYGTDGYLLTRNELSLIKIISIIVILLWLLLRADFKKSYKVFFSPDQCKIPICVLYFILGIAISLVLNFILNYSLLKDTQVVFNFRNSQTLLQPDEMLLYGITLCLFTPFIEEILFRGYMYSILPVKKENVRIILQALFFAFSHFSFVPFVYTFIFGILLGGVYKRTGTLFYPVMIHMGFNFRSLLMYLLSFVIQLSGIESKLYIVSFCILILFLLKCMFNRNTSKRK